MARSFAFKALASTAAAATAFTLAACSSDDSESNGDDKSFTVATSPGPYSELFKEGIDPILSDQGFNIDYKDFTELQQADTALAEGSVDLNVDQHLAYMNVFNEETNSDLVNLNPVPTVKTKIYSQDIDSIDDVADGQTVGIPQDGSNQTRAFRLLEKLGWVTFKDDANPELLTVNDIDKNPHNLDIQAMDSATIPRALGDLDWGVIPGSIAYSSDVDPELALAEEDLTDDITLQAVTTEDKQDVEWAKAVTDAYSSDEFLNFVDEQNADSDPDAIDYWYVPEELKD